MTTCMLLLQISHAKAAAGCLYHVIQLQSEMVQHNIGLCCLFNCLPACNPVLCVQLDLMVPHVIDTMQPSRLTPFTLKALEDTGW